MLAETSLDSIHMLLGGTVASMGLAFAALTKWAYTEFSKLNAKAVSDQKEAHKNEVEILNSIIPLQTKTTEVLSQVLLAFEQMGMEEEEE